MLRASARVASSAVVALSVTALAQATSLQMAYVSAPEAVGPRRGVVRCARDVDRVGEGVCGGARVIPGGARAMGDGRRRVVVHVAGDSTACGVGCASSAGTSDDVALDARSGTLLDARRRGPTLARSFAMGVGESLGADVEWRALGFKGADVAEMRRTLVPALRRAIDEDAGVRGGDAAASTSSAVPHAVVIMCGINDAKRSILGRTSAAFREELQALVREVREVVGEECVVVLPATPLEAATLFPPPLVWVATRLNDLWDEQKAHVSRLTKNVIFVSKPSLESMRERASKATGRVAHSISLVCGDGVHPNDVGYDAWARHIAEECAPTLRRALASQGGGE